MNKYITFQDCNIVPRYSDISSRDNVDLSTELCGMKLNIPVIASPMESVVWGDMQKACYGYGVGCALPRFKGRSEAMAPKSRGSSIPSIGVNDRDRIIHRYDGIHKISSVLIDVAHGHHENVKGAIKNVKEISDLNVIAGNIATPEAAIDLIKWGADALRVGVGGGSVCTTRMKTGVGVPMISCIQEISNTITVKKAHYSDGSSEELPDDLQFKVVPIIADGGMKSPGDCAKALAAGADAVMLGSMLAGTDEAPGEIIEVDGQKMKKYYGSASREQKGNNNYVEGVSELIPYKGSVINVLQDIEDGLRSAFSYVGARNMEEFHENAELIEVSQNGYNEGTVHI